MNPSVAKVRRLLLRALAKADVEDDVKTALEISKMLLPLEQSIEDKKAAAETVTAKGTSDLSTLTIDELLERNALMRERLLELRSGPATSVDAPSSSPIVLASAPKLALIEGPTPAEQSGCQYCHQPLANCVETQTPASTRGKFCILMIP